MPLQPGAIGFLDKRCFRKCVTTGKTSRVFLILFIFLEIVSEVKQVIGNVWHERNMLQRLLECRVLVTPVVFGTQAISAGLSTHFLTQLPLTRLEQKINTTSNPAKSTSICAPSLQPTEPNVYLRLEPITAEDTATRAGSVQDMQMHAGARGSRDGVKVAAHVGLL